MLKTTQQAVREKYGARLQIERWQKFRSQETTTEWLALLGPTAVVLSHQEYMVQVAREILGSSLDQKTLLLVCLAFSVHDLGEAVNGDIAAPDKTRLDEQKEIRAAEDLIAALPQADRLIEAYRQVVAGENAVLHTIFLALERTEYFLTGIHLFEQLRRREDRPEKLWEMVAKILAFDLPKVLDYARLFPDTIGKYLLARSEVIDEMFVRSEWVVDASFVSQFSQSEVGWKQYYNDVAHKGD